MTLNTIDWKNNIVRYNITNTIILVFTGVFLIGFATFTFLAVTTNQSIEETTKERSKLESEISYFSFSKQLASTEVENYNNMLLQLIPEQEDYFLLIASIERFSQRTGLKIDTYSVDVPKNGSEKFTMSISGSFAPSQLIRFLENYQYGTGRLVTIESMSLTQSASTTSVPNLEVRLTLNFYSRKVTTSNLVRVGTLTTDDIKLMGTIAEKMKQGEQQGVVIQQELQLQEQQKKEFEEAAAAAARAALTGTAAPVQPRPSPTVKKN